MKVGPSQVLDERVKLARRGYLVTELQLADERIARAHEALAKGRDALGVYPSVDWSLVDWSSFEEKTRKSADMVINPEDFWTGPVGASEVELAEAVIRRLDEFVTIAKRREAEIVSEKCAVDP